MAATEVFYRWGKLRDVLRTVFDNVQDPELSVKIVLDSVASVISVDSGLLFSNAPLSGSKQNLRPLVTR